MDVNTQVSLLERIRDGCDALAWEEFFHRYWRALYACARSRGCPDDVAEEVVQQALLAVFESRQVFHYDPRVGRFRDWLQKIVVNKIAQHYRRPAERVGLLGDDAADQLPQESNPQNSPEAAWDAMFEKTLLLALLEVVRREVTPETYQAFELTALHDLTAKDAAKLTGLSPNAVYLARKRVLDRLRQLGTVYQSDGRLTEEVQQAMQLVPDSHREHRMLNTSRLMMSRREGIISAASIDPHGSDQIS